MHTTIINDCRDANAAGRQTSRAASLLGGSVSFIGVANDLEAAGNLIDSIDAYGEAPGVILVNVAPRNGKAKKWQNGTPFGYFWYHNVLVVSSIDGLTLSLVKKLALTETVNVMDIPTVTKALGDRGVLNEEQAHHIRETQFRSYDFLPRIAAILIQEKQVVSEIHPIADFPNPPPAIWWIDNFGNCKTTVVKNELPGDTHIVTAFGPLPYFEHLREVPDNTSAFVTGSSGIGNHRFLEIVTQGGNTAKALGVSSGTLIL